VDNKYNIIERQLNTADTVQTYKQINKHNSVAVLNAKLHEVRLIIKVQFVPL